MGRLVLLMSLFAAGTALYAAGSAELLVAIRNGDHAQVQKLLGSGADVNTVDNIPHYMDCGTPQGFTGGNFSSVIVFVDQQ